MPVDTSSYNTQINASNPLQTAGQAVGIGNALQQNQNMQLANQQGQVQLNAQQADLAQKHIQYKFQALANLASDPNLTQAKISDQLAQGVADGRWTATDASNELANLPSEDTPAANHKYAIQNLIKTQSQAEQLATLTGSTGTINTGKQQITGMFASPYLQTFEGAPGFTPNNAIGNQLSPGENASRVPTIAPNGAPMTVPLGTIADSYGNPKSSNALGVPPPLPQGQGNGGSSPTSPALVNNIPGSGNPPNVMPNPTANTPPGALPTGLAPGIGEAQVARNVESQKRIAQASSDGSATAQPISTLNRVLDVSKAGAQTGPLAQRIGNIYATLSEIAPDLVPKGITDQAAQTSEIVKNMGQILLANGNPGSNERLQALASANVHPELLPQAVQALARESISNLQLPNAKLNAIRYAIDPKNSNDPLAAEENINRIWPQVADSKALEYNSLDPADRKTFLAGLSTARKQQLATSLATMQKLHALPTGE